ncbi:MAG: hypothetical protein IKR92_00595 [Alphaproteobacteria bacterium]|nr:hypothetical protein [Alphaproteobacteria bacterium]
MQNFIIRITQENNNLLNRAEIGCFILPDTTTPEFAAKFIESAQKADKLVLAEGVNALAFYQKYGTDGLILDTSKEANPAKVIKAVQKQAPKAVLGVVSRNRRHEAMLVSECEPDFVIFKFWKDGLDANKELLDWYAELFLIQNAMQIEEDFDFSALPADFVILDDVKYGEI